MIGPYTMRTGDRIYLWNGKVGVNAQTLPFPFRPQLLHNSKVCTQATKTHVNQQHKQIRSETAKILVSQKVYAGFETWYPNNCNGHLKDINSMTIGMV